jgi:hypothetical protein
MRFPESGKPFLVNKKLTSTGHRRTGETGHQRLYQSTGPRGCSRRCTCTTDVHRDRWPCTRACAIIIPRSSRHSGKAVVHVQQGISNSKYKRTLHRRLRECSHSPGSSNRHDNEDAAGLSKRKARTSTHPIALAGRGSPWQGKRTPSLCFLKRTFERGDLPVPSWDAHGKGRLAPLL